MKALNRLKTFGCQAWAATKGQGKLGERAIECVFMGYPVGIKGWKLWNIKKKKMFVSRSVHQ